MKPKILHILICLSFALVAFPTLAQEHELGWIPEKKQQLVNDLVGLLTPNEQKKMERRLVAFDDTTSNQIMVLITPDLGGDEIASFAQNVWKEWGIGNAKYNNGVLIVIKPKTISSYGEVRIHTGYGLEGALPDLFCKDIIDEDMIPHFREEDYYGGIVAALDVIEKVCAGEYSYDRRLEEHKAENRNVIAAYIIMILGIVAFVSWAKRYEKKHPGAFTSTEGPVARPYFGSSIGHSRGSWDSFSGGGFGGGFRGFGGGLSGGGGASGRW